jgi:non-specific serine/threonine protein kinase
MPTPTSVAELLAECHAGRLPLPGLFEALTRRGAVPDATAREELTLLGTMAADGRLDPELAEALAARLRSLQGAAADADATRVSVIRPAATLAPAPSPALAPAAPDVTRVQPRVPAPVAPVEATVALPASRPAITGTQQLTGTQPLTASQPGTGAGSASSSSWEQLAAAEGGEHAGVGMLLKGRFLLEREIGRGGMGVVYLARDERKVEARDRDPYVAVKVLNDEFRRHPDSLIALQRESRRAQQLAHDNIVRVYDFDKAGTIVYMTMEYINGSDLRGLIREQAARGMPLAKARPFITGMANALQRAHAAGIVHSDFKPGNVMVTREGVPKVFDFGIARAGKRLGEAVGEETVFDAGTLGALTPAYASLEMIQGKAPTPADDIYALGCVAFELLTGRHPFDKQSAEVALKQGRKPPPVPGLTHRQYKALCDAVAFHSEQRLQDAGALVEGLRDIGMRERVLRPLAYALAGALLLAVAGTVGYGQWQARQVAAVAARFAPNVAQPYANEADASAALASLNPGERQKLMLAHGDAVQAYLLGRVDAYWNPAQGRRDYAAAQRIFAIPAQLGMFLPQLDLRRDAVEKEKQALDHPVAATPAAAAPVVSGAAAPAAAANATAVRTDEEAVARMRLAIAAMLREGEQNFAQQRYSAAIANAQSALQLEPGNLQARGLLRRARLAQLRAMKEIIIR